MPLPPYIHERLENRERYQTVYAKEEGSAAAPTAGLHFTPELLDRIPRKGHRRRAGAAARGSGHVPSGQGGAYRRSRDAHRALGDYARGRRPHKRRARKRPPHSRAWARPACARWRAASTDDGIVHAGSGDTSIFIYPGYKYKAVDALITNFHLPGSTLVMLVSAFMGRENALSAYKEAVEKEYRFFSFGDAMFIR